MNLAKRIRSGSGSGFSLFARLMLIWLIGMALVLGASFSLFFGERGRAARDMMYEHMTRDVAFAVELMDGLAPNERAAWLPRLNRKFYRFRLESMPARGMTLDIPAHPAIERLQERLPRRPIVVAGALAAGRPGGGWAPPRPLIYVETRLADGSPFLIELAAPAAPAPPQRLLAALAALVLGVGVLTWLAVRIATRPLSRLAEAAESLGQNLDRPPLPEQGPREVRHAAAAFNQMQARLRTLFDERTRILAAISHDLQTPITRLRLRAEMSDELDANPALRDKFLADLDAMQALVEDGLALAASRNAPSEAAVPTDLDALLAGLAADYQDAGQLVSVKGSLGQPLTTRPKSLRRLLGNLVDNAFKFGGAAPVELEVSLVGNAPVLRVLDRGPGLPPEALEQVFEPFFRLESSRNRATGGSGLGLAIARQLAQSLGARLTLRNRPEGGLEARLEFAASGARTAS